MANPARMSDWLSSITAVTGVNSQALNRALQAGVITPDMPPEAIYRAVADMQLGGRPARQMQLPLGGDSDGEGVRSLVRQPAPTAMIPYDNGARGFELGPNNTVTAATVPSPGTSMIPAPPRGLPGPGQRRLGTTAGVPVDRNPGDDVNMFGMSEGSLDEPLSYDDFARQWDEARPLTFDASGRIAMSPRRGLPGPAQQALPAPSQARIAARDQQAVDGIASQFDRKLSGAAPSSAAPLAGGTPSPAAAMPTPQAGKRAWVKPALAAGALGGGAIAWNMMPSGDLTNTAGTAELAAESRPIPSVQTSVSPRDQAQALIAQLNQMRRDAGGEVPQARQMMQEIDRLMALSNQQRNAMTPKQAQGSSDPHIQAQALIAQLNEMRQQAGGEVPQAQQIMAEVRRLQAMGDQRRNEAQTRYR